MARWVSAKIGRDIPDISTALCDGLVLLDLVNKITEETDASPYRLTPVYKRPTFALQKMENVDDVLKFCRLVLQMNTCNISAEDIVSGNTKLILGLIWSLFVYASASIVSLKCESRSMAEIKAILLRWLNVICKAKALPELENFNKDWSLQQEKRPHLVFAAVLDFYVPNFIDYNQILLGRRHAELEQIITLADEKLAIPDLALADDFNVLVPDEKCILFYVLEWYMYFEVHKKEVLLKPDEVPCGNSEPTTTDFGGFFSLVLRAVKLKNKYDTKSLRLLNMLNSHIGKLESRLENLTAKSTDSNLESLINAFCAEIDGADDLEVQLSERNNSDELVSHVKTFEATLNERLQFKLEVKPALMYSDIPELQNLSKSLDSELKDGGFRCSYEPLKVLALESLLSKLRLLLKKEEALCDMIDAKVTKLFATNITNIDQLISFMATSLPKADKNASEAAQKYTAGLDMLLSLKNRMLEYQLMMKQSHTTSDLKVLASSIGFYDLPCTPNTPEESLFISFQKEVEKQVNQSNLTFSDIKKFLVNLMPSDQFQGPQFHEFIRLIPTRTLLTRSESNEFGDVCHSDDSDDSDAIFDRVSRTLEGKLSGAHDKIYDLSMLVNRMESGFKV
ncbi:hypothetical protein JCM33374_g6055 [Metschnikowia sp. JCM 33374]|nr:hypothetical protein JCM33374_g6055 [Metschnikowia sp. JCM 33374]